MPRSPSRLSREALAWAFYDWANSAFVLSVLTVFFGGFFASYWYLDDGGRGAFFWQGVAVTAAGLGVAVAAPFLGALADGGAVKKRWLGRFALIGSVGCAGLALVPAGMWPLALALRTVAALGFFGSLIFYDALLTDVSRAGNRHLVSALGFSLGYLGSVLLLLAQFVLFNQPELLGFSSPVPIVKGVFLSVALWWFLFSLPLLFWVEERSPLPSPSERARRGPRSILGELRANFRELRRHRAASLFLLAYFCYIDGVNTFVQMVSAFAAEVGIGQGTLILAIILVQVVGVPCALLFGWLGQRISPRRLILFAVTVYLGVSLYAWRFSGEPVEIFGWAVNELFVLGFLIGLVQGGLQALSRSYFANLIPDERAAAFFGFYNILGKGGAIVGPLLMGTVGHLAGDPRWGALGVALLFAAGIALLLRVPAEPRKAPLAGEAP
ncbi:MAG: MFS transporter [Verrucomicrobiota bacterium]